MAAIMTVRAPENMQRKLSEEARNIGLTRNALVMQILREWMEKNQKEETQK